MVDMDKHACRSLADESYKKKLWPESYITWEFLEAHPRAMEPGYLQIDWDTIPGLYNRKQYLRTLVIEKKEWNHFTYLIPLNSLTSGSLPRIQRISIIHWPWLSVGHHFTTLPTPRERKSTSCPSRLSENRPGTTGFPS